MTSVSVIVAWSSSVLDSRSRERGLLAHFACSAIWYTHDILKESVCTDLSLSVSGHSCILSVKVVYSTVSLLCLRLFGFIAFRILIVSALQDDATLSTDEKVGTGPSLALTSQQANQYTWLYLHTGRNPHCLLHCDLNNSTNYECWADCNRKKVGTATFVCMASLKLGMIDTGKDRKSGVRKGKQISASNWVSKYSWAVIVGAQTRYCQSAHDEISKVFGWW